jgi:ribosomal protein L11 methyltransferase
MIHSLCFTIPENKKEPAFAVLYCSGMLGCEEKTGPINSDLTITGYFKDQSSARTVLSELEKIRGCGTIKIEPVLPQDYLAEWKKSVRPVRIAPGMYASPSWLPPGKKNVSWIKIEPEMAFGTGHHETTRLACRALCSLKKKLPAGFALLDAGCGSGILTFAARHLGAGFCVGFDIDPACLKNLSRNCRDNRPAESCAFFIGTLTAVKQSARFDCTVLNMLSHESAPLIRPAAGLLRDKSFCIRSGILTEERERVTADMQDAGFTLQKEITENEWWCGVFKIASARRNPA